MQITNRPVDQDVLEIGEYTFQIVHEFKYQGTIITDENDINKEIRSRILQANRCYYALKNQFKSHILNLDVKFKIYKTILRPILIYGSECWTLSRNNGERLKIFERKIL